MLRGLPGNPTTSLPGGLASSLPSCLALDSSSSFPCPTFLAITKSHVAKAKSVTTQCTVELGEAMFSMVEICHAATLKPQKTLVIQMTIAKHYKTRYNKTTQSSHIQAGQDNGARVGLLVQWGLGALESSLSNAVWVLLGPSGPLAFGCSWVPGSDWGRFRVEIGFSQIWEEEFDQDILCSTEGFKFFHSLHLVTFIKKNNFATKYPVVKSQLLFSLDSSSVYQTTMLMLRDPCGSQSAVCPVDVPADTKDHEDDPDSTNIGTGAMDVGKESPSTNSSRHS
ncbi:hypothetical protein STEG23_018228 [Scotinomys teguina]